MKRALPMNSMRFISGDTWGMKRLRMSPAKNAPNTPSSPITPDTAALRNSSAITKIYCATESEYRLRNHLAILGSRYTPPATNAAIFTVNNAQNASPAPPRSNEPTIAASTISASVSAIIDAPTQSVTAECLCRPYLQTIG